MHLKGSILGFFKPDSLKIDVPVNEDIECYSWYQIRKDPSGGGEFIKLNDTEKFTLHIL